MSTTRSVGAMAADPDPTGPAAGSDPPEPAADPTGGVRRSRLVRRRRVLLGVGAGAALVAVGGLIGATFVRSPAQLAADTAPPPETVTTAKVVAQDLTASVAMRGVVYPATQYDVSASGAASQLYISKLPVGVGATVANGELLAEIDGAPLFMLTGAVPAWRDLAPGDTGPDVAELQKALAALGYGEGGDKLGTYGTGTADAVTAFYKHLGYTAPANGGNGAEVPEGDVLFLPTLPATVIAVNGASGDQQSAGPTAPASVGEQPGSPFLELSAQGALTLTGELPPAYASQLKPGESVQIDDDTTGITATGTVASVGAATTTVPTGTTVTIGGGSATASGSGNSASQSGGDSGSSGGGSSASTTFIPVSITPSAPLPAALNGENVLVTVATGQTEGPVLTVPVAAIVTTASGQSVVTVVGADGRQSTVPVQPGMSANGYVQITPVTAGGIAAGDNVVVSG